MCACSHAQEDGHRCVLKNKPIRTTNQKTHRLQPLAAPLREQGRDQVRGDEGGHHVLVGNVEPEEEGGGVDHLLLGSGFICGGGG